ncbi:uncharacterized protein HMPREF1541_08923 [Cyphellophora europaea CBS 101466]|uniref:Uncharacterized protein n=1 Tax=Cyphellophora europaea (strain CBS 101466) TaxID=1220924 RepID=W2RJX3_CYPE1|nr:uncharacterized protein HMPREF1541_08923 [Cyphellophora europaea CBS 101466]ETN36645.1 hypothetical protein HMPREF1541_08923 [Cyphellophora europaea CBS 101466]
MDTRNLLALPVEVRRIILVELLLSNPGDGPLPFYRAPYPPELYPAILHTCSQLYTEGSELLYGHMLHFEIYTNGLPSFYGTPTPYESRAVYIGRSFETDSIPPAITARTNHVSIQINARRHHGRYPMHSLQQEIRKVVRLIDRTPHWQFLTLRAYASGGLLLHEALETGPPESLQPFLPLTRLCNRTIVLCQGLDPLFAKELTDKLSSRVIAPHIDDMYEELDALLKAMAPPPVPAGKRRTETDFAVIRALQDHDSLAQLLRCQCEHLRNHGDITGFLKARQTFVGKLKTLFEECMARAAGAPAIQGDHAWIQQELARLSGEQAGN